MSPTDEKEWSRQMQDEDDEKVAFENSLIIPRTPAKKHQTQSLEIQAAPKKPAAKLTTEEKRGTNHSHPPQRRKHPPTP
jgi:hypothetical protein